MFAAMKSLRDDASRRQYALLAINCFNLWKPRAPPFAPPSSNGRR